MKRLEVKGCGKILFGQRARPHSRPFEICVIAGAEIRLNALLSKTRFANSANAIAGANAPSFSAQVRLGEGHPSNSFRPCYNTDSSRTELVSGRSGLASSRHAPGVAGKAGLKHHQMLRPRFHDKLCAAGHESDRSSPQG
jgi:hypothetical protein